MSNLRGGWYGHLMLTMTAEDYLVHMGHTFIPPHNPVNYPPTIGTTQYQALGTKRFQQNQAIFQRYTPVYRAIKKQIVTAVQPVFLSPVMDQLTVFGKTTELHILQHLFSSYREISEI